MFYFETRRHSDETICYSTTAAEKTKSFKNKLIITLQYFEKMKNQVPTYCFPLLLNIEIK